MFKLRNLIWLVIFLFACRSVGNDGGGEVPVETAVPESSTTDVTTDSPRMAEEVLPSATTLPPTWTPQPVESNAIVTQPSNTTGNGFDAVQETAVPSFDGSSFNYIVRRGDTLAEICIKYNVPVTEVARINNIADWDHIEVGEVLIIPTVE